MILKITQNHSSRDDNLDGGEGNLLIYSQDLSQYPCGTDDRGVPLNLNHEDTTLETSAYLAASTISTEVEFDNLSRQL